MQDVPTTAVDVISTRNVLKIFAPAIIIQVSTSEWSYGMYIEFAFYMLSVIKLFFIFELLIHVLIIGSIRLIIN